MAACTFENRGEEIVVQQLHELFGNVLNIDIIKSVANNCHFDVEASSNQLIELTLGVQNEEKTTKNHTRSNMKSLSEILQNSPGISFKEAKVNAPPSSPPKKSKKMLETEQTLSDIFEGYKVLVVLRGMPGSGKSTLAKHILECTIGYDENTKNHILSTDDFFRKKNGVYTYIPEQLSEAHSQNQQRAFKIMSAGFSPVIIDNTNTQMWEMKAYATMAIDFGYIIKILEPDTHWCFNDKELVKRNNHGVSKQSIRNMIERYEKNITPQKLLSAYNLKYTLQRPPQLRIYPPPNIPTSNSNISPKCQLNAAAREFVCNVLNPVTNIENDDTQNLMDFNEDHISIVSEVIEIFDDSSSDENSVDKILMAQGNGLESNVLQPQNSSIHKSSKFDNFPDIQSAWGINEESLQSWDIVTPLQKTGLNKPKAKQAETQKSVELKDSSVNTEDQVFHVIQAFNPSLLKGYRIIETFNRDINRYTIERPLGVPKKIMIDKSSSTDEIFEDAEIHLEKLVSMFPNIPYKYLKYWYEKCKGDIDCTVELILSEKEENLKPENIQEGNIISNAQDSEEDDDIITVDKCNVEKESKPKKKTRSMSEESLQLKKCIEGKIDISANYYSQHLLKVKQYKFNKQMAETSKPSTSKTETFTTNAGEVYCLDPDMEFDDIDIEESLGDSKNGKDVLMEVETVELNLGDKFVSQLESNFGDPNFVYPKGFQPVVQVPVALARELYTFYIESVSQQMEAQRNIMDTLVKEDEEFARKLQESEEVTSTSSPLTLDLQQIMHEQSEISKQLKKVDTWKEHTPDTLSAKLTRDKLFGIFPTVDKETLVEVLYAHNNNYKDTVETLIASTSCENVRGSPDYIKEPPIDDVVLKDMKQAQAYCANEENKTDERKEATHFREQASHYLQKRQELYEKAQQYYQKGMTDVAQFYSQLAVQQTKNVDKANSMAATAFLDEHSKRLQDFNTIDLHYLFVKEAIAALDVFLDRNINLLKLSSNKQTECLQIITGRGKRSENGQSKIKPAVMARLKKRDIRFITMNPGLLKVKIYKTSLVTSELEMQQVS